MANLAASAVTFLLLIKEWGSYRFKLDKELWKQLIAYAAPMVIVGLGGMINETLDRVMLPNLLPVSRQNAAIANAIYGGNYKIAIFITLFITAFRMSAEPFFFAQAADKKAPQTYARVMKWFVIILCFAFLFTALYIDLWKYWVDKAYWSGLGVVPILLAANVCLGIYYNLSVWYKITDRMRMGMYITLMGAALTLTINFAFIPRFGMFACAWATFTAYCSMMIVSYLLGQKYFPVPYNIKRLLAYLGTMLLLFGTQQLTMYLTPNIVVRLASATVLMLLFLRLVAGAEKQELKGMPVVGRWIK
jgi:O-antigen/teichoic acid export membrane protein